MIWLRKNKTTNELDQSVTNQMKWNKQWIVDKNRWKETEGAKETENEEINCSKVNGQVPVYFNGFPRTPLNSSCYKCVYSCYENELWICFSYCLFQFNKFREKKAFYLNEQRIRLYWLLLLLLNIYRMSVQRMYVNAMIQQYTWNKIPLYWPFYAKICYHMGGKQRMRAREMYLYI